MAHQCATTRMKEWLRETKAEMPVWLCLEQKLFFFLQAKIPKGVLKKTFSGSDLSWPPQWPCFQWTLMRFSLSSLAFFFLDMLDHLTDKESEPQYDVRLNCPENPVTSPPPPPVTSTSLLSPPTLPNFPPSPYFWPLLQDVAQGLELVKSSSSPATRPPPSSSPFTPTSHPNQYRFAWILVMGCSKVSLSLVPTPALAYQRYISDMLVIWKPRSDPSVDLLPISNYH